MNVKGVVPDAFMQWILVEGVVVNGLARCIGEATLSTACEGEGDAIEECDGDLSTSEIESDDSGEISDSAYRRSAVPTVRRDWVYDKCAADSASLESMARLIWRIRSLHRTRASSPVALEGEEPMTPTKLQIPYCNVLETSRLIEIQLLLTASTN
jgi:hypothetical protein